MTVDQLYEIAKILKINGLSTEYIDAEHDIIFFPSKIKDFTVEDIQALNEQGVHWSDYYNCFCALM